jgi:hypothetical protein
LRELPPADSAAIRNGGPFVLDLSYDRVNFIARGSITVEGFGEYSLDPKDLAGFAGIDPIFFFYNGGGVDNLNVDFSVNMKEITVYGGAANSVTGPVDLLDPHVSAGSALLGSSGIARIEQPRVDAIEGHTFYVPEPSALVLIAAGLPVLAMLHSTRRRGASGCKPTRTELHDSRLRDHHGGTAWIR